MSLSPESAAQRARYDLDHLAEHIAFLETHEAQGRFLLQRVWLRKILRCARQPAYRDAIGAAIKESQPSTTNLPADR